MRAQKVSVSCISAIDVGCKMISSLRWLSAAENSNVYGLFSEKCESGLLEALLEPAGSKKRRKAVNDVTVKYISGDLPETLDAFYKSDPDSFEFPANHPSMVEPLPTVVRQTTLLKNEKSKQADKSKKEAELEARYDVWNKGIKTLEETYNKLKEQEYESSKPLARYADDKDLTEHLKSQIHTEDPMAQYFAQKSLKKKKKKKDSKKSTRVQLVLVPPTHRKQMTVIMVKRKIVDHITKDLNLLQIVMESNLVIDGME
ncbi:unnamed protein product [Heterobilharzia americana]|nr:unnamed protein product [Heterobilharzia americana]